MRTGLEPSLEEHMMQYKTILPEVRRKAEEARAVKQATVMEDLPALQKRTIIKSYYQGRGLELADCSCICFGRI